MASARWRIAGLTLVGVAAALITMVLSAPAVWIDLALERLTLNRLRLADARGVWWHGEGRLVVLDGGAQARTAEGFALPGRLHWEIRLVSLLVGRVEAQLRLPDSAQTIGIAGGAGGWRIEPGSFALPSADLSTLGSPWNTIQPSAALAMRWEALSILRSGLNGRLTIELREVASAMTPVRPLGSYRISVDAVGAQAQLALSTLSGVLQLSGTGQWEARSGLRFQAQAWGEGEDRARLLPLLGLIGRREGDRTLIRIGG